MESILTGGCACGAVRYECAAEPVWSGHCYCRDCQLATGGAMSSNFVVPVSAVTLHGQVRYHESTAENGQTAKRGFCPNCGSPVIGGTSAAPGLITIKAGSLDDPAQFKPICNCYMSRAPSWAPVSRDLPTFDRMPG